MRQGRGGRGSHGAAAASAVKALGGLETREHGEGIREVGGRGRCVDGSAHLLMVLVAVGNVGLLEKGAEGCLKLPVGRLQQLLRLVGCTARYQHELVDHDLVLELVHVHGHGTAAAACRLWPPAAARSSPSHVHPCFTLFIYVFIYLFFPLYSMGIKLFLHVYIFPPPFVLLQYEYLDIVLNAIQQDLLVNLF